MALLVACGQTDGGNEEATDIVIKGEDHKTEYTTDEGGTLMESLKDEYDVDENDGFISAIGKVEADESDNEFLAIYKDGDKAKVGAGELELDSASDIKITVETYE